MTAKHTPGPWHVTAFIREEDSATPTGRRARIVSACDSADGYLVAAGNSSICDLQRKGALADARLIAAAPELLKAARKVVAEHDRLASDLEPGFTCGCKAVCETLRAAIAAAEGE